MTETKRERTSEKTQLGEMMQKETRRFPQKEKDEEPAVRKITEIEKIAGKASRHKEF